MENASNALLIGGGILIAMLILSIGVYLFINYSDLSASYERTMETTEIQKFNEKFLKFEGRQDITIQEIVSLANFAREYNKENGTNIVVLLQNTKQNTNLADNNINLIEKIIENDTENDTENVKYKAEIPTYNGLVEKIEFKQP